MEELTRATPMGKSTDPPVAFRIPRPKSMSIPGLPFHLSPRQRDALRSDIDMTALEALLGLVPDELRAIILAALDANAETDPFAGLCQEKPTVSSIAPHPRSLLPRQVELPGQLSDLQFEDPHLQSLLEAALAPMRPRSRTS